MNKEVQRTEILLFTFSAGPNYKSELAILYSSKNLHIASPSDHVMLNKLLKILDKGEAQAISLSIELQADLLFIDEKKGRLVAEQLGVQISGLLGLLIIAKNKGIVSNVKQIMDKLMSKAKFRIHRNLYDLILRQADEY